MVGKLQQKFLLSRQRITQKIGGVTVLPTFPPDCSHREWLHRPLPFLKSFGWNGGGWRYGRRLLQRNSCDQLGSLCRSSSFRYAIHLCKRCDKREGGRRHSGDRDQ